MSQLLFLRHRTLTPGWVFLLCLELIGYFPSIWPCSVPVYALYITENTICESSCAPPGTRWAWRLLRKSNEIIHTRQGPAFITYFYRYFLSYLHFPLCPPEGHPVSGMPMNSVCLLVVLSQQSTVHMEVYTVWTDLPADLFSNKDIFSSFWTKDTTAGTWPSSQVCVTSVFSSVMHRPWELTDLALTCNQSLFKTRQSTEPKPLPCITLSLSLSLWAAASDRHHHHTPNVTRTHS